MPIISFESGPQKGDQIKISEGQSILFGRDQQEGKLADAKASRAHFRIKEHKGSYFLKDLDSTNGTHVNEQRIQDVVKLKIEDRIRVGETVGAFLIAPGEVEREDGSVGVAPPPKRSTPRKSREPSLSGQTIGGYEVLSVVGKGGMGTVYLANQISLNREVALKVLSHQMTKDETFVKLFVDEARAAGQLNHPNIVQVYDVGQANGLNFFSMEYLPLGSVEDLLAKEGTLSVERSMAIALDSARGLVYAERKKMVHRDIKPENLMISENQHIKIADLGLAKSIREGAGQTGKEGILGTPHFISPEQAQGKNVDTRSDLYSLGASLYRMLTGRSPFVAKTVKEIVRAQINDPPTPIQDISPETPDDVASVIEQLMEKDPEDRFQSAQELVDALEEIQRIHHYGTGASRTKWIVLGALGIAAAAVATISILKSNEPTTVTPIDPNPVVNNSLSEEERAAQEAKLLETKAELAYQRASMDESGKGPVETVVELYRDIAKEYPKTSWGKKAWEKVGEIEGVIKNKDLQAEKRRNRLASALGDAKTGVRVALTEGNYKKALLFWDSFPAKDLLHSSPSEKKQFDDLRTNIITAANQWWDAEAKTVQDALDSNDLGVALEKVVALANNDNFEVSAPPELQQLGLKSEKLVKDALEKRLLWETKLYDQDRELFLGTFRTAQKQAHELSFSLASQTLAGIRDSLKTPAYSALSDSWASVFEMTDSTYKSCIQSLAKAAKEKSGNLTYPFPDFATTKRQGDIIEVTEKGLVFEQTVSRQKVNLSFNWTDYQETGLHLLVDLMLEGARRSSIDPTLVAQLASVLQQHEAAHRISKNNPKAEGDPVFTFVKNEDEANFLYQRATDLFKKDVFGTALDLIDQLSQKFPTTQAYLSRSDGTSILVNRVHLVGSDDLESKLQQSKTPAAPSPSQADPTNPTPGESAAQKEQSSGNQPTPTGGKEPVPPAETSVTSLAEGNQDKP